MKDKFISWWPIKAQFWHVCPQVHRQEGRVEGSWQVQSWGLHYQYHWARIPFDYEIMRHLDEKGGE